eukprot:SM000128S26211  [mRNA]  locus=s128:181011:183191:+ [translate_table: standard]
MGDVRGGDGPATVARGAPVTYARAVDTADLDAHLEKPRFRKLGFNVLVSIIASIIIHQGFSYYTLDGWLPSPFFEIYIRNIHGAKHGSDTGVFVPARFEELFTKFDKQKKGGFYFKDVLQLTNAHRNVADPFGWFAAKFEWFFTWWLAKDENGFLTKEAVRGIYDGSFFEYAMNLNEKKKANQKKLQGQPRISLAATMGSIVLLATLGSIAGSFIAGYIDGRRATHAKLRIPYPVF